MTLDFGVFNPVFETAHSYLSLMSLRGEQGLQSYRLVRDCCRKSGDPRAEIRRLLNDPN